MIWIKLGPYILWTIIFTCQCCAKICDGKDDEGEEVFFRGAKSANYGTYHDQSDSEEDRDKYD